MRENNKTRKGDYMRQEKRILLNENSKYRDPRARRCGKDVPD